MKWLKIAGRVVVVLIVALAAIPFFIWLDDYIPTIAASIPLTFSRALDSPLLFPVGSDQPSVGTERGPTQKGNKTAGPRVTLESDRNWGRQCRASQSGVS